MDSSIDEILKISEPDIGFAPDVAGSALAPVPSARRCFRGNQWYKDHFGRFGTIAKDDCRWRRSCGRIARLSCRPKKQQLRSAVGWHGLHCQTSGFLEFDLQTAITADNQACEWNGERHYTVKAGELCYVALGQIVNRNYAALYYQPSLITVINSPVLMPDVAEQVRSRLKRLDRQAHCNALCADLSDLAVVERRESAIVRLLFYYPEPGNDQAIQELARPVYSVYRVERFYDTIRQLAAQPSRFVEATRYLEEMDIGTLAGVYNDLSRQTTFWPSLREYQDLIHAEFVRRVLPSRPTSLSLARQSQFVERLQPFPSAKLDEGVFNLLVTNTTSQQPREYDTDALALSCAKRLVHRSQFARQTQAICSLIFDEGSPYRAEYLRIIEEASANF